MSYPDPLFKVVSFYTSDYKADADRLIASLAKFKIPCHIHRTVSFGSWAANTAWKPKFLCEQRETRSGPIVWIDCDAIVRQYPYEFDLLADPKRIAIKPYDIAVHYRRGEELLSGTVWINDTPGAREILDKWDAKQVEDWTVWDQKTLASVLNEAPAIRVYNLPASYAFIFDLMKRESPDVEPVIEHFQASRRTRRRERMTPFSERLF